jgi:Rieske Fe-S protein
MSRIPVETSDRLARRGFMKLCAASAAAVGIAPELLASTAPVKHYARVRLVHAGGQAVAAGALPVGESLVFNYPHATTPCFLLNLGRALEGNLGLRTESGDEYLWPGGVGPASSIVAFSAICAHKMSHPAKTVSFINYRHEDVSFRDHAQKIIKRDGVIFCCSEKSVYDPARGARVLGGPARQPLCAIVLEHDPADDALYAIGSRGGEMFEKFFATFTPRLQMEWGLSNVRAPVTGSSTVLAIDEYSRTQMLCGG